MVDGQNTGYNGSCPEVDSRRGGTRRRVKRYQSSTGENGNWNILVLY